MWEKFMRCFNQGSKATNCDKFSIADLYKRVPPNQQKQFKVFAKKNEEYKMRLRKYPAELPQIDWQFYKQNVRKEMVGWVDEFEHKYDNLDNMIANRHNLIDHSKYFGEVLEQTSEVECDIHKYKEASNERIKILEAKMEYLKSLKPYNEMTMEEFCLAHPNEAPDFINKPTFWPHTPEEQKLGPSEELAHDEEESSGEPKPKTKDGKPDPKKPPPKAPPTGEVPAESKPQDPATAKDAKPKGAKEKQASPEKETKPPDAKAKDAKPKGAKEKQASPEKETKPPDAKANMISKTESQAVEKASQLATQGVAVVQDLTAKVVTVLKKFWEKIGEKRKQVANSAEDKNKKAGMLAAKSVHTKPDDDEDSYFRRESSSDICNKTIIRGGNAARADVKPHHVDLDIEQTIEPDECERLAKCMKDVTRDCEPKPECENDVARDCEPVPKCAKEEKDVCRPKPECLVPQQNENPCSQPLRVSAAKPIKDLPTCESRQVLATETNVNHILNTTDPSIKTTKSIAGKVDTTIVSSDLQQDVTSLRSEVSDSEDASSNKSNIDELVKMVSKTASNAASLLFEAKSIIKSAQHENHDDIESLRSIYEAAQRKVSQALGQAYMAVSSARKLAQRTTESSDLNAQLEKHAMLVKLLAQQAIAMKKEIAKLLSGLEQKKND